MIKLQNVITSIDSKKTSIEIVANALKINEKNIKSAKLFKRAIDARKKPQIFYCDTYLIEFNSLDFEKAVIKKNKNSTL